MPTDALTQGSHPAPTGSSSPSSSSSFTLPAFDHLAFPHILDGVLSHTDPDTLLVLARTSHSVRARVQPHLYRHIALATAPDEHGAVVRLPCAPYRVLSAWEQPDGEDDDEWREGATRSLAITQCVDLCAPFVWHASRLPVPMLRMVRTGVAGVRFFPAWPAASSPRIVLGAKGYLPFDEWVRVRARVFVTHMSLHTWPPQPSWLYDLEYSDEEEGSQYHASRPSAVLQVAMPSETQRLVLHLHWAGTLRAGTDVQILPQALGEHADVVVVLHPPSDEEDVGDDGWFATLLQHLVKVAVQRRARVTIVGVEACSDADLGMRPRPRPVAKWQRTLPKPQPLRRGEELVAAVMRLLDSTRERAWCDVTGAQMEACRIMWAAETSDVEGLSGQVRLLTLEEWAQTTDPLESGPVPILSEAEAGRVWAKWTE
ncbi:hypothetical protein CspHIS471_0611060 [Cutaneotrichosporon sp. HIS471]|nr:hypothetical protein CspHIS471_0611060 [Cutaneotrichosporon sp. HIS471]